MTISTRKTRRGTFYIVLTAGGAEIMCFSSKSRAEAWIRNEIFA